MTRWQVSRTLVAVLFLLLAGRLPSDAADHPRYLFGAPTPVTELNTTEAGELGTTLTADGLDVFFVGGAHDANSHPDIFTARRKTSHDAFDTPVRVQELVAPPGLVLNNPGISADGLAIYYSTFPFNYDSSDSDKLAARTFVATRSARDVPFGAPAEIATLGIPGVTSPEVSVDGLTLYMRVLPLGRDDSDLYVARRPSVNDPWGSAERLAGFAEVGYWESHPSISADSRTLFLENSDFGASPYDTRVYADLALAVRGATDQPWSRKINLGDTINSLKDQYYTHPILTTTAEGSTLYFSRAGTNETGPNDDAWDIYQSPVLSFATVGINGQGGSFSENFDSMGTDVAQPGGELPSGWTFTANDVVFNNATTSKFPPVSKGYSQVANAGTVGDADRALVTDVTKNEAGELDLRAVVNDGSVQALRLGFDIEAWRTSTAANSEAVFQVVLEADTGDGFQQVADPKTFSTDTLVKPEGTRLVNGNDPAYRKTFDSGPLDLDIPQEATLRVRWIGTDAARNVTFGLDNVWLRTAAVGDANIDGLFDSNDMVQVFQTGEYEDTLAGNSIWSEGDWNNDDEFTSADMTLAFQAGNYENAAAAVASVPEPASVGLLLVGMAVLWRSSRRRRRVGGAASHAAQLP